VSTFKPEQKEKSRTLATQILTKVDTRKAFADVLLDHALKSSALDERDRALVKELTYGALRWRRRLDAYLGQWSRRPVEDIDPFLRNLLRLTLYQLLFLDRIPNYAAVNEAVELAKAHAGKGAAGFINGILRNVLRGTKESNEPELTNQSLDDFAEYWSYPDWLVERWLKYFGSGEIAAVLKANNDNAPLVLRANVRRKTREALLDCFRSKKVQATASPWSPQGIIVQSKLPVDQLPGFDEGFFQVQGEASQLVVYLLDPKPGERILDACAAPGGKTTHIAEQMDDQGQIIATDLSLRGIRRIEENAQRLGVRSIQALHADIAQGLSDPLDQPYDRVLVDAPCSGFGTLRSHPEIKWHRTEADILRLAELQKKILSRARSYVKPGGVLVYSTCTIMDTENEKIVENFLKHHNDFVLEDAKGYLPDRAKVLVRGEYFMALPHRHNTDGFFAARIRKVN
jgi:16S rRNA (cytosine967-C5)-methyltransferase